MRRRLPIFLRAAALVISLLPGQAAQAGSEWQPVNPAIPRPQTDSAVWLTDIAALSPSDVWTVGGWYGGTQQTLTARWEGKQWIVVPSPGMTASVNAAPSQTLQAVDMVSSNDVWAAGHLTT